MNDLPLFDPYKALEEIRRNAAREGAKALPQELPQKLPQAPAGEIHYVGQRLDPTSAASATSAGVPHPHPDSRTHAYKKNRKNNQLFQLLTREGGGNDGGVHVCGPEGVAEAAETAEVSLSHSAQIENGKNEVAEVFGDGLRKWRACLSALSPDSPPCPGYRLDEWPRTLARALAFLDKFGPQAEALGWTAPRLFGVHREAGIVRTDACGALVLPICGEPRAITATEVSFGHLTYRVKPGQPVGVPWWEWGR